jgi:hypothetical protein
MSAELITALIIGALQIIIALFALWQNHGILYTRRHGEILMLG